MFDHKVLNTSAAMNLIAMQLKVLGMKRGMIKELTGLSETTIKRQTKIIYPDQENRPSLPNGMNITNDWFFQDNTRLDQACIALKLYKEYSNGSNKQLNAIQNYDTYKALVIIKTYESYSSIVSSPILNINHIAFLTTFFNSGKVHIEICSKCNHHFISKTDELRINCSHCFKQ